MKIAMLNCLKANEVCAGAACLRALNGRTRHFEEYKDTEQSNWSFIKYFTRNTIQNIIVTLRRCMQ